MTGRGVAASAKGAALPPSETTPSDLAPVSDADDAIGALTSPGAIDLVVRARAAARTVGRPLVSPSDFGPLERLVRPAMEQRGDQASVAAVGVCYLWLSTSMHDDYHLPSDSPDKVDPATVATVGRMVVAVIAGMPDRAALRPAAAAR